ncbi:MAG: carbohydrate kinase family protein, partial [Candidatus Woesearchaeota archaeon]
MYDVITCGSATFDVFVQSDNDTITIETGSKLSQKLIAYESGAKILIDELLYAIGGGGTNTAVSFSRLGCKTGYIGCLGDDEPSDSVRELLDREHIDFLGHDTNEKTGYSIILDSKAQDRTILTYKGANNRLDFSQ